MVPKYAFRSAEPGDIAFILDSWLRSYHNHGRVQYANHRDVVLRLLEESQPIICCDSSMPDVILGWICSEGKNRLHYVYVKAPFRRLGICSRLLEAAGFAPGEKIPCSHITYSFEFLNFEAKLLEDAHVVVEPTRDPTAGWGVGCRSGSSVLQGGNEDGRAPDREKHPSVPGGGHRSYRVGRGPIHTKPEPKAERVLGSVERSIGNSNRGVGPDAGGNPTTCGETDGAVAATRCSNPSSRSPSGSRG